MSHRRRVARLVAVLALALALPACRLAVTADVVVGRDGGGELALAFRLDRELRDLLEDAGVEPLAGLDDVAVSAPDWTVERVVGEDDVLELRLSRRFADPGELGRLVEELHSGLGDGNGALLREVELTMDSSGGTTFRADAGVVLPATAGASGDGVSFTGDDLAELLRERDGLLRYDLRLALPGPVTSHDADEVVDGVLVWHLPVGRVVPVSATAAPPSHLALWLAGGGAAALLAALGAGWARSRRHVPRHPQ